MLIDWPWLWHWSSGQDLTPDLNNNTPIAGQISVSKYLEGKCKVQEELDIETADELASLTNTVISEGMRNSRL